MFRSVLVCVLLIKVVLEDNCTCWEIFRSVLVRVLLFKVVLEDNCTFWEMFRSGLVCVLLFKVVLEDDCTCWEILECVIVLVLFLRVVRYIFLNSIIPQSLYIYIYFLKVACFNPLRSLRKMAVLHIFLCLLQIILLVGKSLKAW